MARCLFTGSELDQTTREEHTIQRALGGRVKSVVVSSSSFNERSGQRLDPFFSGIYAEVMHVLGPALPSEARSGSVEFRIPGHPGRWKINDRSQLVLIDPVVIARDSATGRPLTAIGPDLASLEPMIRQLGSPPVRRSESLPTQTEVVFPERAMLHWRVEVAALKAILLTFDHLLQDDPERFTRSGDLAPVREFVRQVVESDSDEPDVNALADYSFGVQYDPDYLAIYDKLRTDAGLPATPFGHTLLVSADANAGTLDAVFWAFDTDPHAFRLTKRWSGASFTYVVRNGILLHQSASTPIRLNGGRFLGRLTNRRCRMRVTTPLTDEERHKAGSELSERRRNLYQRAVNHVERNCDSSVAEQFSKLARLNENGDHRVSSAVISHLITLFAGALRSADAADTFVRLVAPIIDPAGKDRLGAGVNVTTAPTQGWQYWLARYRECLDALQEPFGLPGHIFQATQRTTVERLSA